MGFSSLGMAMPSLGAMSAGRGGAFKIYEASRRVNHIVVSKFNFDFLIDY